MLARLDRFADVDAGEATHHAARLVAAEFDGFLDLIDRDQGPARTGMFLAARIHSDASDPDLGAIAGLARADRWLRTGAGVAAEVDTADLDPDARAGWTAEQWVRAEAAGLVAFAPVADTVRDSPLSPLHPDDDAADADDAAPGHADEGPDNRDDEPAWWDEYAEAWRTRFPPPAGFAGEEDGTFGDADYERDVTPEEEEELAARRYRETATRWVIEACERDRWFAALNRCPIDPADDGDDGDDGDDVDDGDDGGEWDAAEAP